MTTFAVELPGTDRDPRGFYKKGLVEIMTSPKYSKLTIAGIDVPAVLRGIEHAGPGSLITVGTAKNHDINWVERPGYAREKGYAPVYDLIQDWNKVTDKLDQYYNEKYPKYKTMTTSTGAKVEIYPHFIKIDNNVYPWMDKQSVINEYEINTIIAVMRNLA